MNYRLFFRNLFCAAIIGSSSLYLSLFSGCKKEETVSAKKPPVRYQLQGDVLKQVTTDSDDEMKFGVIADSHGTHKRIKSMVDVFQKEGVDAILIAGDMEGRVRSIFPIKNEDDIIQTIEPCAKSKLPVFVVPGNHDQEKSYNDALEELAEKYDNIYDMTKIRIVDGDDVDIVSLPGCYEVVVLGGFNCRDDDIRGIKDYAERCDDEVVLLSHFSMKFYTKHGIDRQLWINKGNKTLRKVVEESEIHFGVCGHIHRGGKRGCDLEGNPVKENEFSEYLYFNPGDAHTKNAGIFTVKGDRASYEHFKVE